MTVMEARVDRIVGPRFNCFHTHPRQGAMKVWMIKMLLENGFAYHLDMPNPDPPLLTGELALEYEQETLMYVDHWRQQGLYSEEFKSILTIQITELTTVSMLREAYALGIRHAKIYPKDVTTNSEFGVFNYVKIYPVLTEAERLGMFIHFHGEHPSYDVEGKDKEADFLDKILVLIMQKFPKLKIVLEHISTKYAVEFVMHWNEVMGRSIAATIATPYLILTQDDVIGYSRESGCKGNMHHLCKPCLKWRADRKAIRDAAMSGKPYFFLGTDTAPHLTKSKYALGCACGNFSTPVTGPIVVSMFEEGGKLDPQKIGYFTSHAGADWFGLPRVTSTVTYVRQEWKVPLLYEVPGTGDGVVPMCAGWTMGWQKV